MAEPFPKSKQIGSTRVKPTQKQMGAISKKMREQVFERSNGACEHCDSQRALHMAHIIGRKQIDHITTAGDLLHVCVACHKWLDETIEGIQLKRRLKK